LPVESTTLSPIITLLIGPPSTVSEYIWPSGVLSVDIESGSRSLIVGLLCVLFGASRGRFGQILRFARGCFLTQQPAAGRSRHPIKFRGVGGGPLWCGR
jgi:hypothetical protein